jgi:hypothetical protein
MEVNAWVPVREKETAASSALSAAMERDKRCGPDKIRAHDLPGYGGSLVAGYCHCTAGCQVLKHPVGSVSALRPHVILSGVFVAVSSKKQSRHIRGGRDSSVGITTRYGLVVPGIESRWRRSLPCPCRPVPRPTWSPVQRVPGLSLGVLDFMVLKEVLRRVNVVVL